MFVAPAVVPQPGNGLVKRRTLRHHAGGQSGQVLREPRSRSAGNKARKGRAASFHRCRRVRLPSPPAIVHRSAPEHLSIGDEPPIDDSNRGLGNATRHRRVLAGLELRDARRRFAAVGRRRYKLGPGPFGQLTLIQRLRRTAHQVVRTLRPAGLDLLGSAIPDHRVGGRPPGPLRPRAVVGQADARAFDAHALI